MTMTKTLGVFGVGVGLGADVGATDSVGGGDSDAAGVWVAAAGPEMHDAASTATVAI